MPAYSEDQHRGGGLALNFAAQNSTDVRTELGSRFDAPTLLYGKPLVLQGRVAWAYDFVCNPATRTGSRCGVRLHIERPVPTFLRTIMAFLANHTVLLRTLDRSLRSAKVASRSSVKFQ